jgi:hypothetical protein
MKIKQNYSTTPLGSIFNSSRLGFPGAFSGCQFTHTHAHTCCGRAGLDSACGTLSGGDTILSFLEDYVSGSRFLIILPLLILAEPRLRERLALVARHFEADLVPRNQWPEFQANWNSCESLRNSKLVRILILVLTYATAAFLSEYLSASGSEFVLWWRGGRLQRVFACRNLGILCQLPGPRLLHLSVALEAISLGAILEIHHSTEPSTRRGPSRQPGRLGVSRGFGVRTDSLQFLPRCRAGWRYC